tara:strand:- start:58 stop:606 length:549 start_codon:yes stop_codon:yes gene_type:complete
MKKSLFPVFSALILSSFVSYSQNLNNQLDKNGEKQGTWIIYLDDLWAETDSINASYYFYTFYEDDVNTKPNGKSGKKKWKLSPKTDNKSTIVVLDGEYKWTDKNGTVRSIHRFKNGEYLSLKEFDESGKLVQHFDYENQYGDNPHTYRVSIYEEGKEIKYVMRDGTKGWMLYNDPGEGSEDD